MVRRAKVMESPQKEPSEQQKENLLNKQDLNNGTPGWSLDFPNKKHLSTKDCLLKPNSNKSTSKLEDKNKQNFFDLVKDSPESPDREVTVENLMEMVDLSDLTFSCNDFIFDDCICFEQASQFVDPTIKDSDSTPISFNNSDSVQLFRFSLTENIDDVSYLAKDNLFSRNLDCKMVCRNEKMENEHCKVYHSLDLFASNMNVNNNLRSESCKEQSLKKKDQKNIQMKKGRRYLPNFKQKVLEYAKSHTFKETASHFKINCNTITVWSQESKTLSVQNKKTSMPGSDCNNYKTDTDGTSDSKTEIILLNEFISFETEPSELKNIENDLPQPVDMKPDERFIKWVEAKRLQRRELTKQEVFQTANLCLRRSPLNQEKPSWFVLYLKRLNKALKNSTNIIETEKYIKYPVNFKLEVALYARIFTKNTAARVFNVPRRRIFDWVNRLNPLKDSFSLHGKNGHSESALEKDKFGFNVKKDKVKNKIYSELRLWYQNKFLTGAGPTSNEIKEKAKAIFTSYGVSGIKFSDGWLQKFCQRMNIKLRHSEDDRLLLWVLAQLDNNVSLSHQEITEKSSSLIAKKKFKGSKGWTLRFLKRHKNLLQNSPSAQDALPQIVQDKLDFFWENFRRTSVTFQIEAGSIGCMDEVPLSFNYPEEKNSASLPLLRKTGFENCQGVVILSALASGRILPPVVVFKGSGPKQLLSNENVHILILYQEKGLITYDVLEAWFLDIWLSCTPTPSALIVDSFEPHCSSQFKQLLARENCLLHVIPEGCSSRFQPLDVEVTPTFKDTIKKQWKEFSVSSNSKARYRCPDRDVILRWVQEGYEKIRRNPVSIKNNFKTIGLLQ